MQEHDYEPSPGLPAKLPGDEALLWQGKPGFRALVKGTFHIRALAIYFAAMIAVRVAFATGDGHALREAVAGSIGLIVLAAVVLVMLAGYARMLARTTLFTITSKRIVIRAGIALPVTMNLPFSCIERVGLRTRNDGSGDVAIETIRDSRPSFVLLFPFVKPFRLFRVQPVLRGVAHAERMAEVLVEAIGAETENAAISTSDDNADAAWDTMPATAPESGDRRRWFAYPTLPLAAASALVVFSLVVVGASRIAGVDNTDTITAPTVNSVELFFEDREDGSVVVVDASDAQVLEVIEPGADNFIRGALRSLARARRAVDAGAETPVVLRQTADGRLLLSDPVSGREIDLWAFGVTNAQAFGRFLQSGEEKAATGDESRAVTEANMTAAAMNNQESKQ